MLKEKKITTQVDQVLSKYRGLRLTPSAEGIEFNGSFEFSSEHNVYGRIDDCYELRIAIPSSFPQTLPKVRDCGSRIPRTFHTNGDGSLCLASPVQQMLVLSESETVLDFLEQIVVPYLYGFSYFEKHKELPFGELEHGKEGLIKDYTRLFGVESPEAVPRLIDLAAMKRRVANKQLCPCGSGKRLGKCHNRQVNALRSKLGRKWFNEEVRRIEQNRWGS